MNDDVASSDRTRSAGCFAPEEVRLLDAVLDATMREALRQPGAVAHELDTEKVRSALATSIIAAASTGDLDPHRLKACALAALAALADIAEGGAGPRPVAG